MSNVLFPMAAALAVGTRMCTHRDKSAIAPVSAAERVVAGATVATTVGFNQGGRLPRGVPR